jgi:hypothetical protein
MSTENTVTVYEFNMYDLSTDQVKKSRRMGTRNAIENIANGWPLEETKIDIPVSQLSREISGMTEIDFNPHKRPLEFQTQVTT